MITINNKNFTFSNNIKNKEEIFFSPTAESLEDEPVKPGKSGNGYHDLDHIHTVNLPQNIELLGEFRKVLDDKTAEDAYNPRFVCEIKKEIA